MIRTGELTLTCPKDDGELQIEWYQVEEMPDSEGVSTGSEQGATLTRRDGCECVYSDEQIMDMVMDEGAAQAERRTEAQWER